MDRHELTARIAYQLFEHRGHAHGRDREDWSLAEAFLSLLEPASPGEPPAGAALAAPAAARPRARAQLGPRALARPERERAALERLAAAVAREGRAALAARLGWASTGPVGALLRGDRALSAELVARIEAACGEPPCPGAEEGERRAA